MLGGITPSPVWHKKIQPFCPWPSWCLWPSPETVSKILVDPGILGSLQAGRMWGTHGFVGLFVEKGAGLFFPLEPYHTQCPCSIFYRLIFKDRPVNYLEIQLSCALATMDLKSKYLLYPNASSGSCKAPGGKPPPRMLLSFADYRWIIWEMIICE